MPFRIRMGLPEMEARRFEEMDGAALKPFRRGWCLGSEEFKQKMLVQMGTSKSLKLMLLHWRHAHENANILGRLVPGFMRGESQRESGAAAEGQLDWVIEVAVQCLQDEERIIHGG